MFCLRVSSAVSGQAWAASPASRMRPACLRNVHRAGAEPGEVQLQRTEPEPSPLPLGVSSIPGSRSSTTGSAPLSRSSQASMSPTGPPPTITTSARPARPGGWAGMARATRRRRTARPRTAPEPPDSPEHHDPARQGRPAGGVRRLAQLPCAGGRAGRLSGQPGGSPALVSRQASELLVPRRGATRR
jgi:hypothetical protein